MGRIRFRVRTLMTVVAFSALVLTLAIQGVLLQRAKVREQAARAEAAYNRARAVREARIAEQKNAQLQQLIYERSQRGDEEGKR
jgi:hypothetical protein